jgi:hypothetical protein
MFLLLPAALLPAQTTLSTDSQSSRASALFGSARLNQADPRSVTSISPQDKVFARIMAGNGWETTLVLVNMGPTPLAFNQLFFRADGTPISFTVRTQPDIGTLTTSSVQGILSPNSTLNLILFDTGSPLQEGWSLLSYDDAQTALGGYALIRHRGLGGSFSFETTIPLSGMRDYSVYMQFDNTSGFRTQLTVVNPASNLPAQVLLTYRDPQGQVVLMDWVNLRAEQQMTIDLPDSYPDLANRAGTIHVEANINVLSVVGLRYNEVYGTIANVPSMN